MRRILAYLTTLGMMMAMVIAGAGLAAALDASNAAACVNATTFNFNVFVEDGGGETQTTSMQVYLNADAADTSTTDGDGFGVVADEQTEVIELQIFFGTTPFATAAVIEHGVGPDRWGDTPVDANIIPAPDGWVIHLNAGHGTDPFIAGTDVVAQVFAEADTSDGIHQFDLGAIPVDPCPGSLYADLDSSVGTAGYLTDATSDEAFAWVNTRSTFQPTVTNHGPDDDGDASLSWALDLQGSTLNTNDGSHAVIGTHFNWGTVLPCQAVNTGTIGFRPTMSCNFQVLAGETATGTIHVDWNLTGAYFIDTRVVSRDRLTNDTVPANNVDHIDFAVLDPAGDEDTDGITNGIDGSLSGATFDWDVLTFSSNFSDEGQGGTTFGTVVSGNATVADAVGGGVTVTTDAGGAEIAACGQTTQFVGATTATITCGSITVAVASGQVEVSLSDGSTVMLDGGDEVTVDADEVTVLSGEAIITREDNSTVTVSEGNTWSPDDIASDSDGDGVLDGDDLCAGTVLPEPQPERELKKRHYVANADGVFMDSDGNALEYTVLDTGGCSGHQIIEALELGRGHVLFGITQSAIEDWIATLQS